MAQHDDRFWETEVCRLQGILLLKETQTSQDEAQAWLRPELDIARRQEVKLLSCGPL